MQLYWRRTGHLLVLCSSDQMTCHVSMYPLWKKKIKCQKFGLEGQLCHNAKWPQCGRPPTSLPMRWRVFVWRGQHFSLRWERRWIKRSFTETINLKKKNIGRLEVMVPTSGDFLSFKWIGFFFSLSLFWFFNVQLHRRWTIYRLYLDGIYHLLWPRWEPKYEPSTAKIHFFRSQHLYPLCNRP